MTLGQLISQAFGTSAYGKDAYAKQKDLYSKLGSPLGNYVGNLNQNLFLMKNQNKWKSTLAPKLVAPKPKQSAAKDIVKTVTKDVKTITPFEKLVNPGTVVNEDLIRQFGDAEVAEDAFRESADVYNQFRNQVYSTGGNRFDSTQEQNLLNSMERSRAEQAATLAQAQRDNLQAFYNQNKEDYYLDPNSFKLNNFKKGVTDQMNKLKAPVAQSKYLGNFATSPLSKYYF